MTSDNQFRISRRKVLAGLGTIGIASAGAGLGTSAYFSDVETYEDNVLTAGALDLTVDWEEHYFHDTA
ncbi:MAG: TasA family protein, partial [Halobacterium sp.]